MPMGKKVALHIPDQVKAVMASIYDGLPGALQREVDSYTWGVLVDQAPSLESKAAAFYRAYAPLRDVLRKTVGARIPMYRGQPVTPPGVKRRLLSWSTDPNLAAGFAEKEKYHVLSADIDVRDVVAGFVSKYNDQYIEFLVLNKPKYQEKGSPVPEIGFSDSLLEPERDRLVKAVGSIGGKIIKTKVYNDGDEDFPEPDSYILTVLIPAGAEIPGFRRKDFSFRPMGRYFGKVSTAPKYETQDGRPITFKVILDDPMDQMGVERGHKNQRVVAYVDGEDVGYIKWSYIPNAVWERRYPTVWEYKREWNSWYAAEGKDLSDVETLWETLFWPPRFYGTPREKPDSKRGMQADIKRWLKFNPELVHAYEKTKEFWVDKPVVTYVNVSDAWRRQHIGLALYKYAARCLALQGLPLFGDTNQTDDARAIWKKMRSMRALPVKETDFQMNPARPRIDYRRVAARFLECRGKPSR